MKRTHSQEWLEEHALFSCQHQHCREEVSYPAGDLLIHPKNGKPVCIECYQEEYIPDEWPSPCELEGFNPFGERTD